MKFNLFLSVLLIFTVFHLCKAGPLRHHLQKRAVFYIANETACVVDNIVYTNGDPIPTDDPCEACRCRPPGFACVLKECKVKPGCRAIRHVGQCCPEYICGCEHDGRFYQDGEAIIDPKNPCYECYCQGSSIACAFIDCIYRDECDSLFVPGECCPRFTNCTGDIPDRNLFLDGSIFPPINLLPTLNGGPILTSLSPAIQTVEISENPSTPIQPEEPKDSAEIALSTEKSESEAVSATTGAPEPEIATTEAKNSNTEVELKDTESLELSEKEKQDLPREEEKVVESNEKTKTLLTSESDASKDGVTEISAAQESDPKLQTEPEVPEAGKELPQPTEESKSEEIPAAQESDPKLQTEPEVLEAGKELPQPTEGSKSEEIPAAQESDPKLQTEPEVPEARKELPQPIEESKSEEIINEAEVTEKPSETELTTTEITEKAPQIKNSASENSKSLKLSDEDQLDEIEKEQQNVKPDSKTTVDTITELVPEATSVKPTEDLKESSTIESKPQSEEKAAEESQANTHNTAFYSNNPKVKSESAETVTIVVHVKEGAKLPTETDFIAETVTPASVSNVSEENLMKSNDEISTSTTKETSGSEDNKSTDTNDEIFPTTMKVTDIELSSKPQSTDQNSDNIQERSDDADNIALEAEENPVSEGKVLDLKSEDNSLATTTTMGSTEVSKEARTAEEITEGTKIDEPTATSKPTAFEIITDSTSSPKPETSTTESTNLKIDEVAEEKEPKNEKIEETVPEAREDPVKTEEKTGETTPSQSEESTEKAEQSTEMEKIESTTTKEASTLEEKIQESTPTNTGNNLEMKSVDEIENQKSEEKIKTENMETDKIEENKSERTTESQNQETKESKQTTVSSIDQ